MWYLHIQLWPLDSRHRFQLVIWVGRRGQTIEQWNGNINHICLIDGRAWFLRRMNVWMTASGEWKGRLLNEYDGQSETFDVSFLHFRIYIFEHSNVNSIRNMDAQHKIGEKPKLWTSVNGCSHTIHASRPRICVHVEIKPKKFSNRQSAMTA